MTKKIKIIALAISLGVTSTAFATTEGWFVGLNVGATTANYNAASVTAVTSTDIATIGPINPSTNGAGAGIFTGYNFNRYAAMQFGFTHYGTASYNIPATAGVVGSTPEIHTNVVDILGVALLPFGTSGFDVFAKAGLAVVRISKSTSLYAPTTNQIASCQSTATSDPALCAGSGKASIYARPEVVVGASYDFTPNWVMEASYSQVIKGGAVPNLGYAAIGLSYHWVDLYCGQFLC